MTFLDSWQSKLPSVYAEFARLVVATPELEAGPVSALIGVAILWPIRSAIQEFEGEALDAVRDICGAEAKHIFKIVQDWDDDPLTTAHNFSALSKGNSTLTEVLEKLNYHFQAASPFAQALAQAMVKKHGRGDVYNIAGQIKAALVNIGGTTNIQSLTFYLGEPLTEPRSAPFTVPPLPRHFVERPAEYEQLRSLLLTSASRPVGLTTVFQGGGGFGKTTLAMALGHDVQVRAAFPDGILFITLGEKPANLLGLLLDQLRLFQPTAPDYTDLSTVAARLREQLTDRRVLLILDDVWSKEHAHPFIQANSATSAHLLTTRNKDISLELGVYPVEINQMTSEQASELLLTGLTYTPTDLSAARDLANFLSGWPQAVRLANGLLKPLMERQGRTLPQAIARLKARLQKHGLKDLHLDSEVERHRSIGHILELSLAQLDQWSSCYLELAIFPENANLPWETLFRYWMQTDSRLDEFDCETALDAMERLSLFAHYDPAQRTIRLHDIIRRYLKEQYAPSDLPALHIALLAAHRPTHPSTLLPAFPTSYQPSALKSVEGSTPTDLTWADLSPTDPYLWDYLAYHLIEADLMGELAATVKELRYLILKTYLGRPAVAEADLEAVTTTGDDETLTLLWSIFRQQVHLLSYCDRITDQAVTLHERLRWIPKLTPLTHQLADCLPLVRLAYLHPPPDLPHPALIRTLSGHTSTVYGCAFSPDGRTVVSASRNNTLKLWNVTTGQEYLTLSGHTSRVRGCAFSPDGQIVVSASEDQTLKLWDVVTGQERLTLSGHTSGVVGCAFSPDGQTIVSASFDETLKLWDAATGQERLTLVGHMDKVYGCAFSPAGRMIVSASEDQTLKLWDVVTGQEHLTLSGHTSGVVSCVFSPDGQTIVSASEDKTLKLWDIATGQLCLTLSGHTAEVWSCAFSPDGQTIVSASEDKTLKLWDIATGQERLTLFDHTATVWGCAFSPDGQMIVSVSQDKTLKLWGLSILLITSMPTSQERLTMSGHTATVWGCVFSPDGRIAVSASADKTLKLWDVATGHEQRTLSGHLDKVYGCAFSPDGQIVVSASEDQTLKLWDVVTGQERLTLSGHTSGVVGCAFSPDGQTIVSASFDETLKLWDAATGQERLTLVGHTAPVYRCAFSHNGRMIVSASEDQTLKLWDTTTGHVILTLTGHTGPVYGCAFNYTDQVIVSASEDQTLKLWDLSTVFKTGAVKGQESLTLANHKDRVWGCAFSPNGQMVFSASADKTFKLWDATGGSCLASIAIEGGLSDCAVSPDGRLVFTGGTGGVYFFSGIVDFH